MHRFIEVIKLLNIQVKPLASYFYSSVNARAQSNWKTSLCKIIQLLREFLEAYMNWKSKEINYLKEYLKNKVWAKIKERIIIYSWINRNQLKFKWDTTALIISIFNWNIEILEFIDTYLYSYRYCQYNYRG